MFIRITIVWYPIQSNPCKSWCNFKKEEEEEQEKGEEAEEGEFEPGPLYSYEELLARLYRIVESNNPEFGTAKKYVVKPPSMVRVGSKKVAWVNFTEICNMMNRSTDHVTQFVLAEFGTEGSIAGDGQLILKGRYQPKHAESLLRKYIREYVTCEMCRSPDTTLTRDPSTRLYVVACTKCNAARTAASIKSGYHAVTRADRRAAKQAKA